MKQDTISAALRRALAAAAALVLLLAGPAAQAIESTARQAWEHGYNLIVAEDACATMSAEMHAFAMTEIMPRISRIRTAADIAFP